MAEEKYYAVALIRVSSKKQGLQGDSPEDQLEQIERKAIELKIGIREVFTFMESASGELQPSQAAIDYCKNPKNRIKFCIVKSIDRFTRGGVQAYSYLKSQLDKVGADLIDCQGVISNYKVNTMAHLGLEYSWSVYKPSYQSEILTAERYKDEIRDIQTRMLTAAVRYIRLGFWRGSTQIGYATEKIETSDHGKRHVLRPHPIEGAWFVRMYELSAQGNLTKGQIVDEINKMGFRTRERKYRDKTDKRKLIAIKGGRKLSIRLLTEYIQKPIYCGVNTEKWTNGKPVRLYGGGLVSIELWNKANLGNRYIEDNNGIITVHKGNLPSWRVTKNKLNPNYPYKHYVLCPVCKKPLMGSASKGKQKYYPAYHCSRNHKSYRIPLKDFTDTIKEFVQSIEFTEEFKREFEANFIKNWDLRIVKGGEVIDYRSNQIAALQVQIDQITKNVEILTTPSVIKAMEKKISELMEAMEKLKIDEFKDNQENENLADIGKEDILRSLNNFMEHPEIMLLEQKDPLKNAAVFGIIFDEKPTYEDLTNGTPQLAGLFKLNEMYQQGQNLSSGLLRSIWEH